MASAKVSQSPVRSWAEQNGRVLDNLARRCDVVHPVTAEGLDAARFLDQISCKSSEQRGPIHAIIDVGAYFKGFTNTQVAENLRRYFGAEGAKEIKGESCSPASEIVGLCQIQRKG